VSSCTLYTLCTCLQLIQNTEQHSVSYTLSRTQAVIVQYDPDQDTDMFQIGRSSEGPIDFVVMDTVPGDQRADNSVVQQSTISRFACRIIVERTPPYVARIYAAGFDVGKNIFLGVRISLLLTNFFSVFSLYLGRLTTFLYCQDPSPLSVWPYSPNE